MNNYRLINDPFLQAGGIWGGGAASVRYAKAARASVARQRAGEAEVFLAQPRQRDHLAFANVGGVVAWLLRNREGPSADPRGPPWQQLPLSRRVDQVVAAAPAGRG